MSNQNIDVALGKVRDLYLRVSEEIEKMKPGEKIAATKLTATIATELGTTGPTIYPILKILYDNYPGITFKKGAQGGLEKM
jgi:hypothetical protein